MGTNFIILLLAVALFMGIGICTDQVKEAWDLCLVYFLMTLGPLVIILVLASGLNTDK